MAGKAPGPVPPDALSCLAAKPPPSCPPDQPTDQSPDQPPQPLEMELALSAPTLKGKDRHLLRGRTSDAFFVIYKEITVDSMVRRTKMAESEVIKNIRSAEWKPIVWPHATVEDIRRGATLKIGVYDKDQLSSNDLIGTADLPLNRYLRLLTKPLNLNSNRLSLSAQRARLWAVWKGT